MDPLSLTSSILAFMDTASKIKGTLDQVGANRKRLRELSANVTKGIVDIEDLLLTDGKHMNSRNGEKLREHLDTLKAELELVHRRCCRSLERRQIGPLSGATATVSQWFHRGNIDAMINRLEKQVHACYLRCQVLISSSIYSTVLLHREEHRNNMERLESAFSRGIIENDQEDLQCFVVGDSGLSKVDWDYLRRQVQRVIESYDRVKPNELTACEEPSGSPTEEHLVPWLPWGDTLDVIFNTCLKDACYAFEILSSTRDQTLLQDCAQSLLFLGSHLQDLFLNDAAEEVLKMAISLYSMLIAVHPSFQYQRCLANGLLLLSAIQSSTVGHLSVSEHALNAWKHLYDFSGHIDDMSLMASVLPLHCSHLHINGFLDEALDFAQQNVVLAREYNIATQHAIWSVPTPTASWTASGEADVVFSSSREFSSCTHVAMDEANALWVLARSLAANGRFAEAHIAGSDALSCLDAILQVDPWWKEVFCWDPDAWRVEFASWVSIPPRPSQRGLMACIDEVDEEDGPPSCVIPRPRSVRRCLSDSSTMLS